MYIKIHYEWQDSRRCEGTQVTSVSSFAEIDALVPAMSAGRESFAISKIEVVRGEALNEVDFSNDFGYSDEDRCPSCYDRKCEGPHRCEDSSGQPRDQSGHLSKIEVVQKPSARFLCDECALGRDCEKHDGV